MLGHSATHMRSSSSVSVMRNFMTKSLSHLEFGAKKVRTRAAGGVPHQAHEGLALTIRGEIREESNPVSEIGGHPKRSGIWSGIFLDCGISRGFCSHSTPRGVLKRP
jgi:hypothetical protein